MKTFLSVAISLLVCATAWAQQGFAITSDSAGKIRIGMTLAQLKQALPGFQFSHTSDGDGVPLVAIAQGKTTHCYVYAGDNRQGKIDFIEVVDERYQTADGVHPGMSVRDAEKALGKLQSIQLSEIESREFATFKKPLVGIGVRLYGRDGQAGTYPEGARETTHYNNGAYIYSLSVTGPPQP